LENPVGARVTSTNTVNNEQVTSVFTIIGVTENFNFESLRTDITPLVMFSSESAIGFEAVAAVRLATNNFNSTISDIEQSWKSFNPDRPFTYTFLNNDLAQLYEAEQTSGKIFGVFAIIAILIACVGLFGLAAYIAFQRTKEIGVRKVLGASITNVVLLLSKDFAKLVGISFVIATPVSWLLMKGWLSDFAFRTELSVLTFIIAGLLAFAVAIFTISYQAISAAIVNPVKSLKSE
jgi:putative ABC transport system permease protein